MILSPEMTYIIDKEPENYPSPSEKEKLNKIIGRYRLILETIAWKYDIAEIKFALADLLVGRNDPGDFEESHKLYDDILRVVPDGHLKAKALIGKAELLIGSSRKEDLNRAVAFCDEALSMIDSSNYADFFVVKGIVVKAEIINKRNEKGDTVKAFKLFHAIIKKKSHWYFKARASIGLAELMEYKQRGDIRKAISLCEDAIKLLKKRPDDYFTLKAKIIQAELLTRKGKSKDLKKAEEILNLVIKEYGAHRDLIARAKLDLAELSKDKKAEKLTDEVYQTAGLDPYIIEKARMVEQDLSFE